MREMTKGGEKRRKRDFENKKKYPNLKWWEKIEEGKELKGRNFYWLKKKKGLFSKKRKEKALKER